MMGRLNYFQNRPKAGDIDINAYLNRIKIKSEPPSLDYLKRLHRTHLIHIPFENLDIHYNKKIILDYKRIFKKVIYQKRGGYCYELNGLFFHLLYHLGFDVRIISAGIKKDGTNEFSNEYDHMALVVNYSETDYLVDVGFGKGMIYPKKIENDLIQMDYTDYWRFIKDANENYILQSSDDASTFTSRFKFSKEPRELIQFIEMNEFHQTDSRSHFLQKKLISKLTETGRVTLTNQKFQELKLGSIQETQIVNEDEFLSLLEQHFGITLQQLVSSDT